MKNTDKNINDLLSDYCTGNICDADLAALRSWMDESQENREQARHYLRFYRNSRAYAAMDKIDGEKALDQILSRVKDIKRRRRILFYRSAAAVAVLAIAGVFVLDRIGSNGQEDQTIAQVRVIEPGEAKALLLLDDGTSINLEEIADSTIQTSGGTSIAKENEIIDYRQSRAKKVVYNTIRIPRGGEYTLVLSDGTKVYLNSDSELRYPVRFLGKERKVYLKGEGYLEVAENQEMPFIVDAMGIEVEVLGTEFNIKADAEDKKVETTLVEGRIVCYRTNHKEDATVLIPGYQAVATGTGEKLEVRKVDTRLYTSWKDGLFVFERLTLPEIFVTLGRWYNVEARFEDPALMNLHFTGDLERYENINTHLEMIGLTTHVKFEIEGETVYIRTE